MGSQIHFKNIKKMVDSIIGSLVKKVSIVNISDSYTMPINLQAGLYLTRFNFADGSSSENKFIVK